MNILVTGATGNIGTELVHLLSLKPAVDEVRAATRKPQGDSARLLAEMNPAVVKPTKFSTDEADLEAAFEGVDTLVLIAPLSGDMVAWQKAVLGAAGNIKRIVKVSVDAARSESEGSQPGTPPADHWAGEEMISAMNVEHAILRPTVFMQHFMIVPGLYERGDDTFYLPIGNSKLAMLDCRDIAFAAAELATRSSAELPADPISFTGPEALSGDDLREHLALATGRTFTWNREVEAFKAHSEKLNSPEEVVGIYQAGAEGAFTEVKTGDFEKTFGRTTTSFAKFAADYTEHFGG